MNIIFKRTNNSLIFESPSHALNAFFMGEVITISDINRVYDEIFLDNDNPWFGNAVVVDTLENVCNIYLSVDPLFGPINLKKNIFKEMLIDWRKFVSGKDAVKKYSY